MKREEKNQQTKRRIMDSALAEFSRQGYGASSVNTICAAQNISKGIVYHYFATKDELYLACVEECFVRLTEYLKEKMQTAENDEAQLEQYFTTRLAFFQQWPLYQRLFCEAVTAPPAHLKDEVQKRKQEFDALNTQILEHLLALVSLRPQVTMEEVIETFRLFQDFINIKYQVSDQTTAEFANRETHCQAALDILLYGVVEREEEKNG